MTTQTQGRTVCHVVDRFVEPSQVWLEDLIGVTRNWNPVVLCREELNRYPGSELDVREVLPMTPLHLSWSLVRRWERFTNRRVNPWRRVLRRHDPTVFHAHFGPSGWACVDAGHANVVTTFYGFDMSEQAALPIWRRAYRTLFERGAHFLCEGPHMAAALIALGAPEDRTSVQPLIADLALPYSPPPTSSPTVLMAGRFVEKKNFIDGINAFDAVAHEHDDATLVVMGAGPLEADIRRAMADAAHSGRMNLRPFADRATYRKQLGAATILMQPSKHGEHGDSEGGAPTTLLDAQAVGTLIVGSDHADIPFVTDHEAAILAPEGDLDGLVHALHQMLTTRDTWTARAEAGLAHVRKQHAPEAVGDGLQRVYETVARSGD